MWNLGNVYWFMPSYWYLNIGEIPIGDKEGSF